MALLGLALKFVVSLLLWPLAACFGFALGKLLCALPWAQGMLPWFAVGFCLYVVVQVFFWRPLFLYVMGHELTHALAAVLQGGQADDLHVSTKGGQVKVNKSNFVVNLAPYFFPIYTAMASLIWLIAADRFRPWLAALIGFTLAFHFALTLFSLKQHQSDITEVGWLFAIPLIVALNLIITAGVLRLVAAEQVNLHLYFHDTWTALVSSAAWAKSRL